MLLKVYFYKYIYRISKDMSKIVIISNSLCDKKQRLVVMNIFLQ